MDYSKSIMEIVEAHLSPSPKYGGGSGRIISSVSGTNSDIDAAISEAGLNFPSLSLCKRDAISRAYGIRKYGK